MDKNQIIPLFKAYLISFFIFLFVSPFLAILFPPIFALFIPFLMHLLTFYFLGGFKTIDKNIDFIAFISIFSLSTILLSIESFCFSKYQYLGPSPLFLIFLILIPLQTLSEEIIFRSFPLLIAKCTKNKLFKLGIAILSALIFATMHYQNPEALDKAYLLYYFLWGLLAQILTFYTASIWTTYAFHLSNNLFISIVMNYPNSAIPINSLFVKESMPKLKSLVTFTFLAFFIITLTSIILKKRNHYAKTEKN